MNRIWRGSVRIKDTVDSFIPTKSPVPSPSTSVPPGPRSFLQCRRHPRTFVAIKDRARLVQWNLVVSLFDLVDFLFDLIVYLFDFLDSLFHLIIYLFDLVDPLFDLVDHMPKICGFPMLVRRQKYQIHRLILFVGFLCLHIHSRLSLCSILPLLSNVIIRLAVRKCFDLTSVFMTRACKCH